MHAARTTCMHGGNYPSQQLITYRPATETLEMARLVAKFRTPCLGKCQKSAKTRHNTYSRSGEKDETIFALVSAAR